MLKKKSVITILSVGLNLVLLSALAYSTKVNDHANGTAAPIFRIQYLPEVVQSQNDGLKVVLASDDK